MVREITVDENYQTVRLFDAMKKGDIYEERGHLQSPIRQETA